MYSLNGQNRALKQWIGVMVSHTVATNVHNFKQEKKMSHFTKCYMINEGSKISVTHPKVSYQVIQTEHFVKKTSRMQVIIALYNSA